MTQINGEFWKPKPKEPWSDWRTYSMLIPILAGALGACIFFALGLAFAEIINIRADVRKPMVLVASFGVAIGSTFGSIGSGIEVFRKAYKKQATAWDWASLIVSIVTTVVGMVMGFASLLGATEEWSRIATIYGCIVVGAFASLDTGGDMIELGGLFGSHEDRVENWRKEKHKFDVSNGQAVNATPEFVRRIAKLESQVRALGFPTVTKAEYFDLVEKLNGKTPSTMAEASEFLATKERRLPNPRTAARWGLEA